MDSLEYIDNHFRGNFLPDETRQFEKRIEEDPAFAEEVAFYLSARQVAREQVTEEKKIRFREIYSEHHNISTTPIKKLWKYAAAAAVIAALFAGGYLYWQPIPTQQLADQYIKDNFEKMSVKMSTVEDSLNMGKSLYNDGNYSKSLQIFGLIIQNNPTQPNFDANEKAGIVSLKLKDYDKALAYFRQLEKFAAHSNRGKFFQALTLMERDGPNDKQEAKKLLLMVVRQEEEGNETAREWLKNF